MSVSICFATIGACVFRHVNFGWRAFLIFRERSKAFIRSFASEKGTDIKMENDIGIIREVDKLGRVVIPKEFRKRFFLEEEVEILATDDGILIRNPKFDLVKVERKQKNQ